MRKDIKPGEVIFTGEVIDIPVNIQLLQYNNIEYNELKDYVFKGDFLEVDKVNWLNLHGIHNIELIKHITSTFDIHNLNVQDLLNINERTKLDENENYLFINVKSLIDNGKIENEQISFVLGKNYLLSFQEKPDDLFEHIRLRIRNNLGIIRKKGADYLLYMILDAIVDNYFIVMDKIVSKITALEENVLNSPKSNLLIEVEEIKKEINFIKNKTQPLFDTINRLNNFNEEFIDSLVKPYFSDLKDNLLNLNDYIEYSKNSLDGVTNIYLSSLSNNLNVTMKILTVISTIFIPLTFIAGIYGMNFEYMPELKEPIAYPIVLILMLFISISMLIYFKKKKFF
jgi:magnesium transporter